MTGALLSIIFAATSPATAWASVESPVVLVAELKEIAPLQNSEYLVELKDPNAIDYALSYALGRVSDASMPAGELRHPWQTSRIALVEECMHVGKRRRGDASAPLQCIPVRGPYQGRAPF